MKPWLRSLAGRIFPWMNRRPVAPARKSRPWSAGPTACETLEGRALLTTTSAALPFATMVGEVSSTSKPSQVVVHLNPGQLRSDRAPTVVLGLAVTPVAGSSVSPEITRVTGPNGRIAPVSIANRGNTAADKLARQSHLFARVIPLTSQSQDITVNVSTLNKKTGNYIVEAFLAGDVTGDGNVDASDLAALKVSYGSNTDQTTYNPAADINGDGRVGSIDRQLISLNQGAHVVGTAAPSPLAIAVNSLGSTSPSEVNLVPTDPVTSAATSTAPPVAIATPVTFTTPVAVTNPTLAGTPTYVPVTLSPTSLVPTAPTSTVPLAATSLIPTAPTSTTTPFILSPVYSTNDISGAMIGNNGSTIGANGAPIGTSATSVYPLAPPVAPDLGSTTAPPIYVYGQPVVNGSSTIPGARYISPGATLFGQTTVGPPVGSSTPLPVYLYDMALSSTLA